MIKIISQVPTLKTLKFHHGTNLKSCNVILPRGMCLRFFVVEKAFETCLSRSFQIVLGNFKITRELLNSF